MASNARLAVLRAADGKVEAFRRLVLRMATAGRRAVPDSLPGDEGRAYFELTEALDKAEEALEQDFSRLIFESLIAGAEAATEGGELVILAAKRPKFDSTQDEVLNWVRKHAGKAVSDISAESRRAIREALQKGFQQGLSTAEIAALIRPSIGVNRRQAIAAWNRYEKLLKVMPQTRAQAAVKRYIRQQIRERAWVIAKDQTLLAANEGQRQVWLQARKRGEIDNRMKRRWITARDERVCPRCGPMHGEEVGIDEPFSIGGPPAHSRCRCGQELVREAAVTVRKLA